MQHASTDGRISKYSHLPGPGEVQEHRISPARELRGEALLLNILLPHRDQLAQAVVPEFSLGLICADLHSPFRYRQGVCFMYTS